MAMEKSQVDDVRQRFISLNKERLARTKNILRPRQRDLVDLLPVLFHVNHSSLPGFVGHETPVGVSNYAIEEQIFNLTRRTWKGFDLQTRAQWTYAVESIFLMGSVGTIAFSQESDIDIWLCVKPELLPEHLALIQKKAEGIEAWYAEQDLEIHFFVMTANDFREGKLSSAGKESSGSAQHKLLLDEFYRTAIWVAGKHPSWWFVPPDREKDYDKIRKEIQELNLVEQDECIDFGSLPSIPPEEFFGAAVWQLFKAVDSPYKSILKIMLMETYAAKYPKTIPLSNEFKRLIYEGVADLEKIDPYILLLNRAEEYLAGAENSLRMEVVRRSFYMKVGISLSSQAAKDKKDWRHNLLRQYVEKWGWDENHIFRQDSRPDWRITEIMEERKMIMDALSKSYLFLSKFAKNMAGNTSINQKDLTLLGRKLYAAFDRKPGKIDVITRGIGAKVSEDRVTIMLARTKSHEDRWLLFRGKVVASELKNSVPLKTTVGLVELLTWAYFNQVISENTQKLLYAPGSDCTTNELIALLENIRALCREPEQFSISTDDLQKTIVIEGSVVFLNVGKVAKVVGAQQDKGIISGSVDVLKVGTVSDSLFSVIEIVYINSWKEVYVKRYEHIIGLMNWLRDYLAFDLDSEGKKTERLIGKPNFFSFSSHYGHTLTKRVASLYDDSHRFFFENDCYCQCYVIEAARNYFVLVKMAGELKVERFESYASLVAFLEQPSPKFRCLEADSQTLMSSPLPVIFKENKEGAVQIFYESSDDGVFMYFMDEKGSIFLQKSSDSDVLSVLSHYYWFVRNKLVHQHFGKQPEAERDKLYERVETDLLEFHLIRKEGFNYSLKKQELVAIRHARRPFEVKAIGTVQDKQTQLSFVCGNRQINAKEQGSNFFKQVAETIMQGRSTNSNYPLYITALELQPPLLRALRAEYPQTIYYLKYKKKIEDKLNAVVAKK